MTCRDWPALNMQATRREAPVHHCQCGQPTLADVLAAIQLQNLTLNRMETAMATVVEALQNLAAQQTEASNAQTRSFTNLQDAIDRLERAVRDGEVSPEIQAAVDNLSAGFDTMTQAANSADDGHEPQPTDPNA